jgi:hypothetical protein
MSAPQNIRESVRQRYAEAATRSAAGDQEEARAVETSCCGAAPVATTDDQGKVVFGAELYGTDAAQGATEAAVAASLGCGVPTAVADLHPGEVVLEDVLHLLDRLRDRTFTHVLLVALPEATPVHEAARRQADLARSGITPTAWVLNQCLAAATPTDPVLMARAASEHRYLTEVATSLAERLVVQPRVAEAPTGAARLRALVADSVPATC